MLNRNDNNLKLNDYIKNANIHVKYLTSSFHAAQKNSPLSATKFAKLDDRQTAFLDMMATRFGKLQDLMGSKIFPLTLDILGESNDTLTLIDKLNRLEKIGYMDDANWWMDLRDMRNHITHDYPNEYEILAIHFNDLIKLTEELLTFWAQLNKKLETLLASI